MKTTGPRFGNEALTSYDWASFWAQQHQSFYMCNSMIKTYLNLCFVCVVLYSIMETTHFKAKYFITKLQEEG